jgi:hypothetical protein
MGAELPKAIHDRLARDERLAGMLTTFNGSPAVFYGEPPERAELPCVQVGVTLGEEPRDTKLTRGRLITREVIVLAERNGDEAAVDKIAERVCDLLHNGALDVHGYDVVSSRVVDGPRNANEGDAYGRTLQVRVWLQEARS